MCGMPFIPEEGNNTLTYDIFIPPSQGSAKYTDDTSDTHSSFGFSLLESAFPFPLSFLLSTVCLRCLSYSVIRMIFSGAVPFISANSSTLDEFPIPWKRAEFIDIKQSLAQVTDCGQAGWESGRRSCSEKILDHTVIPSPVFSRVSPAKPSSFVLEKSPAISEGSHLPYLEQASLTYHLIHALQSSVQR